MNLKVMLTSDTVSVTVIDRHVAKITAEGLNGPFGVMPDCVDFVTTLAKGLLSYITPDGEKLVWAAEEGVIVKLGRNVWVSCHPAVKGMEMGPLPATLVERTQRAGAWA